MNATVKIPAEHPFLNAEIIKSFTSGITETLHIMASEKGVFKKPFIHKDWKAKTDICVCLDLESGNYVGQIRFHFSKNVLAKLYFKMLNENINPESSEILDCAGEFSNMCYGNAKTMLNEKGFLLQLTLPNPCKTEDLADWGSPYPQIIIPYLIFNEECSIQIVIY